MTTDPFRLVRPCAACPFRADKPFPLHPDGAAGFAAALKDGYAFHCHKTIDYGADTEEQRKAKAQWCAGAMVTMERSTGPNLGMRLARLLGLYDPADLDMTSPTYPSLAAWVASYDEALGEPQ